MTSIWSTRNTALPMLALGTSSVWVLTGKPDHTMLYAAAKAARRVQARATQHEVSRKRKSQRPK